MNNKRLVSFAFAFLGTCTAVTLMLTGVSYAHVEPDPIAVEAGKSAAVTFSPAHGCDGSPTISLAFLMPENLTDAAPVQQTGWTAEKKDRTITFSGGSLAATDTTGKFGITFTAPSEAGTLYFPAVQKCEEGQNNWIDRPNADGSEAEFAAPSVRVTAGPPTSSDFVAPEEVPDNTAVPGTMVPGSVVDGTAVAGTEPLVIATSPEPGDIDLDADSSNDAGIIIAIVAGVIAIGGVAVYVVHRRNSDQTED